MLLLAAGCGRSSDGPEIAAVSGIVRYNGAPFQGAYVQFSRQGAPIVAAGFTDDAGRFKLTSYEQDDGAPVGENKVRITAFPPPTDHTKEVEAKRAEISKIPDRKERRRKMFELSNSMKGRMIQERTTNLRSGNKLPKRYASEETSQLSFTVKAGEQNECEFNLTD